MGSVLVENSATGAHAQPSVALMRFPKAYPLRRVAEEERHMLGPASV
jgi:hypothetical protein